MPLNYNPSEYEETEGSGYAPKPGKYQFKIDTCEPTEFQSGNEGLKLKLLVDGGGRYEDKCFDNVVFTKKSLWKMKQLCEAIGVSFDPPPEPWDIEGKTGWADFKTEEYNGYTNLKVAAYIPQGAEPKRDSSAHSYGPPPMTDDVPF